MLILLCPAWSIAALVCSCVMHVNRPLRKPRPKPPPCFKHYGASEVTCVVAPAAGWISLSIRESCHKLRVLSVAVCADVC
jgi:hypothetical protein